MVSAGHEYADGTRGSGIVSSTANVLGMSKIHKIRNVDRIC